MRSILEQQYILAKKCNISISDSNLLPDFEREIYISILIKDMEEEKKALDKK